jgi:uncharacterized protein (TIGR02594 family)
MSDEEIKTKVSGLKVIEDAGNLPRWMTFAIKELGQKEIVGNQHNPRILEYHKTTSLKANNDETAWCSSFVNWCLKQAFIKGTGRANARSWLDWGYPCSDNVLGSIVVMTRGDNPANGHVGFLAGFDDTSVYILSGNQDNMVKYKKFDRSIVLDYRWPFWGLE